MLNSAPAERRTSTRYLVDGMVISIRRKGRLGRLQGVASNFNCHGLAVFLDQPLSKDKTVYVSIQAAQLHVENVIGVVHNCTALEHGYRCGIQFRVDSHLQMDRDVVQNALENLQEHFSRLEQAAAAETKA